MRKGISPIVAVVLLIAIAVIAAVGLYFWVGGLATKQPTPNVPIVLSTQMVTCGTSNNNITLMVQNLAAATNMDSHLLITAYNGTCTSTNGLEATTPVALNAGKQTSVKFNCSTGVGHVAGSTYVVYSNATDESISQAQFVC